MPGADFGDHGGRMSTRFLILTALACGVAILVAGALQILLN
jgi:hypothetical protein